MNRQKGGKREKGERRLKEATQRWEDVASGLGGESKVANMAASLIFHCIGNG